jgi:glyoxylase-like metal-dependent hydrolase (beta-lactamase superfamily II)
MTAATASISRPPGKLFTEDLDLVPTMIHAASTTAISVHPLRRNIAVLEGSGGNITVLTGEDGTLLVDAGFSVSQLRISAALDSISQEPIRHLINTHWHTDHTDGNQWLHSAGAAITAQENTRRHLSVTTRSGLGLGLSCSASQCSAHKHIRYPARDASQQYKHRP